MVKRIDIRVVEGKIHLNAYSDSTILGFSSANLSPVTPEEARSIASALNSAANFVEDVCYFPNVTVGIAAPEEKPRPKCGHLFPLNCSKCR